MEYTRSNAEGQAHRSRAGRADVLADILETKYGEVRRLEPRRAELRAEAYAAPAARGFERALREGDSVALLAEIKRRSPSAGAIRPDLGVATVARAYRDGGASALSVLTDERYFGGSLQALHEARAAVDLPLLRKDFVVDEVQVWEARAAGADAVLLIVRALDDARLGTLRQAAVDVGMDVLVEVHDEAELERALAAGATLVGVNNRDLRTFETDLSITFALAPRVPRGVALVAESGIRSSQEVRALGEAGVDAVLVGEALMRKSDISAAARDLVGHPRGAVR